MSAFFDGLASPWRVAFEEAWASFAAGNFGIGAVLVDPRGGLGGDGEIVSVGRNRVAQVDPELRTLSGNMTAHAEMNAFAALDRFNAEGLHMYTTLEPCLMCIGTAMQLKLRSVDYAAVDEFYAGMDELWQQHPVTADRQPTATGPLEGPRHRPLANFARMMPMAFTLTHFRGRSAERLARDAHPALAAIIDRLSGDDEFRDVRRSGTLDDALGLLWADLQE